MMGLIITCNRYGTLAVRSLNEPERNRKSAIAQVMMGMMLSWNKREPLVFAQVSSIAHYDCRAAGITNTPNLAKYMRRLQPNADDIQRANLQPELEFSEENCRYLEKNVTEISGFTPEGWPWMDTTMDRIESRVSIKLSFYFSFLFLKISEYGTNSMGDCQTPSFARRLAVRLDMNMNDTSLPLL